MMVFVGDGRRISDAPRVFAPDSAMWKIVRHRSILLDGPAAAVLQIAHPRVGLGVMEHSHFADAPLDRLEGTLDTVYAIAFGTVAEANAAADRVRRKHRKVAGDAAAQSVPGESRYSAGEIELLLWVVATLVWSAIQGYERTVGPLDVGEKERFYHDMRILGTFFDLPIEYGPRTYIEYQAYFQRMIADPLIGAHAVSRRVAWAVARPQTPWWFRLSAPPITVIPPAVRDRLGFRSTRISRFALKQTTIALRLFNRFAPRRLRFVPQYLHAMHALLRCDDPHAPPGDLPGSGPTRQPVDVGGDHRVDPERRVA
jgi:uncharacterized protein (DUF2236 family)